MRGLLATVLRNYEIKVDQSCLSCEDNRSVREESTSLVRENTFRERVGTVQWLAKSASPSRAFSEFLPQLSTRAPAARLTRHSQASVVPLGSLANNTPSFPVKYTLYFSRTIVKRRQMQRKLYPIDRQYGLFLA
jgi:hypothetical protein